MRSPLSWRDLLGRIVDTHNKQRVAAELGITSITLSRWISGESVPRSHNLRLLLYIFPEYRSQFLELLRKEFCADFMSEVETDSIPYAIPSSFYARFLHNHCQLPRITHLGTLCDSIIEQGLKQLDPNNAGLYLAIFCCTPPASGKKVRSLYERTRGMTFIDARDKLLPIRPFFGRGSLVGDVLGDSEPYVVHSQEDGMQQFKENWWIAMNSAVAVPIHRANSFAGSLIVYSQVKDYFRLPSRLTLIQQYADLLAVAFETDDFYPLCEINLASLPPFLQQIDMVPSTRQRLAMAMSQHGVNLLQAERLALQQIEAEMLDN